MSIASAVGSFDTTFAIAVSKDQCQETLEGVVTALGQSIDPSVRGP